MDFYSNARKKSPNLWFFREDNNSEPVTLQITINQCLDNWIPNWYVLSSPRCVDKTSYRVRTFTCRASRSWRALTVSQKLISTNLAHLVSSNCSTASTHKPHTFTVNNN